MFVALTVIAAPTGVVALALMSVPAAAQAQSDFAPLNRDGNGVPALRRVVSGAPARGKVWSTHFALWCGQSGWIWLLLVICPRSRRALQSTLIQ